jgi:Protein of unknown function (DUF1566)
MKKKLTGIFAAAALFATMAVISGGAVPDPGARQTDGTIYAGVTPQSRKALYTTAADATGIFSWRDGTAYCAALREAGHDDWRMPPRSELGVLFANQAAIGGFDQSTTNSAVYWSSDRTDLQAWGESFRNGIQFPLSLFNVASVRCVRADEDGNPQPFGNRGFERSRALVPGTSRVPGTVQPVSGRNMPVILNRLSSQS